MASMDDMKQKEAEADTLLSRPAPLTKMGEKLRERETGVVEVRRRKGKVKKFWLLHVLTVFLMNAFLVCIMYQRRHGRANSFDTEVIALSSYLS